MKIHQSGEDYLETIYLLNQKQAVVRSIDIANEFNYSKASISRAMKILKAAGFIEIIQNHNIVLTEAGKKRAREVYERHLLIRKFLMDSLDLTKEEAEVDACKIEHILSDVAFAKIKAYVKK